MFIVPIKGDKILTKDSSDPLIVSSFTNLKSEPAVYLVPGSTLEKYIYFSDVVEVNGVRVEYDSTSKLFNALGPLKRRFNLPQPHDTILVKLQDVPYKDEPEEIEVKSLRLHSHKHGLSQGLLVGGAESFFNLVEILDIQRRNWYERFNREAFQKYYFDYLPTNIKSKT